MDDSNLVRGFVKELLVEAAYAVLEARDAPQALSVAAEHPEVDLLIADLLLPGANGVDLAKKMRAARPGLKVLLLSADSSNAVAAAQLPGARFMDKNGMVEQLTSTVAELLRSEG